VVPNDGLVLFDEPLSNLDAKLRERMRLELLALHSEISFSALYVTHDQTEATAQGDPIAVMNAGEVAQVGTPDHQPASRYVAEFVGSANEIEGVSRGSEGVYSRVETSLGEVLGVSGGHVPLGEEVAVLFRPEHCRLLAASDVADVNTFPGRVEQAMFLGSHVEYLVAVGKESLVVRSIEAERLPVGTEVQVRLDPERVRFFPRAAE
jgi:iron(III) transport system ATP-binding protein